MRASRPHQEPRSEADLRYAHEHPFEVIRDLARTKAERIAAAFALELLASDEAVAALEHCLFNDPSPIVRHEAAFALGETANKRAVEPLMNSILRDRDIFVRHEAAMALGTLGLPEAKPLLQQLLEDPAPAMRESAEIALQRIDGKD